MRLIKIFLLLVAIISVLAIVRFNQAASASGSGSCLIRNFQAQINSGPTQGMLLNGTLSLQSDYYGNLTGFLRSNDGQVLIKVSGTVNGYALNLAFDLGYSGRTQTYVFGTGTLHKQFPDCSGATGGLLEGPQTGDSGIWSAQGS